MLEHSLEWLRSFVPQPNTVPRGERMRAVAGALVGLFVTAILSDMLTKGSGIGPLALVAPMGASAVLLFCVPASPLAQPWSVIGGNTISALIGIVCAKSVANPALAAPLAGACAIFVMFLLRCLHPPSGAVALTAVLGGPAIHAAGFTFAFLPVCLNSTLIVLAALVFNNLTGRRYPHNQKSMLRTAQQAAHATRDPAPLARLGFTAEDLDAVLARYGQVLDVSRDDLEEILLQTEQRAYARRFGGPTPQWTFLTGPLSTVDLLAVNTFHIGTVRNRLNHSTRFMLVDKNGHIRAYESTFDPGGMDKLQADAEALE